MLIKYPTIQPQTDSPNFLPFGILPPALSEAWTWNFLSKLSTIFIFPAGGPWWGPFTGFNKKMAFLTYGHPRFLFLVLLALSPPFTGTWGSSVSSSTLSSCRDICLCCFLRGHWRRGRDFEREIFLALKNTHFSNDSLKHQMAQGWRRNAHFLNFFFCCF